MYQRLVMNYPYLRLEPEEDPVDAPFEDGIDDEEETGGKGNHDHHHHGRDERLPPRRPGDLVCLLPHLLKEFKRTCSRHYRTLMAGAEGLEPPTCGFGDRRSTN